MQSYILATMLRRQDGQIIPALVMMMLALVVVGMLFFQVGRAAIFSTEAQTAADAAALAAVKNVQQQLMEQVAATGTSSLALIDSARVRGRRRVLRAAQRRPRDQDRPPRRRREGVGGHERPARPRRGAARPRGHARLGAGRAPAWSCSRSRAPASAAAATSARAVGGGDPTISKKEWDELGEEIGDGPPTCGSSAASNDLVKLGNLLREHGFAVGENAEMGDNPAPGVHSSTGYHYQCRNSAALDVNHDQFNEARRDRRDHRAAARARLPHDLARRGPLRPHPHRRRRTPARSAAGSASAARSARSRRRC